MLMRRCTHAVLKLEDFTGSAEVNITFVSNEEIRMLNKQYRNIDAETDVLSFGMANDRNYDINPETGAQMLGDVVISIEKAMAQAKKYDHSLQREVGYLTAHSILHLLGYDHQNNIDRLYMREKEERVMSQLGLPASTSYIVDPNY